MTNSAEERLVASLRDVGWDDADFEVFATKAFAREVLVMARQHRLRIKWMNVPIEGVFTRQVFQELGFPKNLFRRTMNTLMRAFKSLDMLEQGHTSGSLQGATIVDILSLTERQITGQPDTGKGVYAAIQLVLLKKCGLVYPMR
jgi:hypothetical protein